METNKNIFDQFQLKEKPKVPEAYFENLANEVMGKAKKVSPIRVLYKRPVFWFSAAAAMLVLFVGIRFFTQPEDLTFEDLSDKEILAYVEENLDDIETELLIETATSELNYPEKESSENQQTKTVSTSTQSDSISKEDILHYLNSQEVDLEAIEELY